MKLIIIVSGLFNGLYIFIDGIFVMLTGKYIGYEKPGPWSLLFQKFNIDVFKLGPVFIMFGTAWLFFVFCSLTKKKYHFQTGLIISICTMWYLPVGTFLALLTLIFLVITRKKINA